jgi:heat shock protein HslJ
MEEAMIARTHSSIDARMRVLAALTTILILALLAACGTPSTGTTDPDLRPSGQDSPLTDTEWVLTELRGEPPLGGGHITLVVGDSTAGGSSGCNLWGGEAVVTASTLALEMLHMTARACEDTRLMDQETDYLALLGGTSTYEVQGHELVLETETGEILVFRSAAD